MVRSGAFVLILWIKKKSKDSVKGTTIPTFCESVILTLPVNRAKEPGVPCTFTPSLGFVLAGRLIRSEFYDVKQETSLEKLLIIDHINKIITQKRQLNPPSFNALFRDKVKKKYPDYELR